jgi:hypothetical protein
MNDQDARTTIEINPDNVVFLSSVSLPTKITGLDGEPKTLEGTAIAMSNGMMLNSSSSIDELIEILGE